MGGLIVAVVVKYADNILKGFAASISIISSCVLSIFFFDFKPNAEFLVGAVLVNVSMYLYSQAPAARKEIKAASEDQDQEIRSSNSSIKTGRGTVDNV